MIPFFFYIVPVLAVLHNLNTLPQLTLYKLDISLRWTVGAGPKGVCLRES